MSKGKRSGRWCCYFLPTELIDELEQFLTEQSGMDYVDGKGTKPNKALDLALKLREATEEK